ncbi:MAG: AAA family ATPase [Gemmatales bacterium]|nr:AAA family ATPase [Gemmatales bacterium]
MISVEKIIKFILENNDPDFRQWPCLVGTTGTGKTSLVKQFAKENGMNFAVLLPGTSLPEDILGLPKVENSVTAWTVPDWANRFINEPGLIFIDELDKARPENHAVILTLLSDLRIRNITLHPDTKIICAMQPIDPYIFHSTETGKALCARLVFIPRTRSEGFRYVCKKHAIDESSVMAVFNEKEDENSYLPVLELSSPRQLEAAVKFCRASLELAIRESVDEMFNPFDEGRNNAAERAKEFAFSILRGMFPQNRATRICDIVIDSGVSISFSEKEIKKAIVKYGDRAINRINDDDLGVALSAMFNMQENEEGADRACENFCKILLSAVCRGHDNFRSVMNIGIDKIFENLAHKEGVEINVLGSCTPDEFVFNFNLTSAIAFAVMCSRSHENGTLLVSGGSSLESFKEAVTAIAKLAENSASRYESAKRIIKFAMSTKIKDEIEKLSNIDGTASELCKNLVDVLARISE